MIKNSINKFKKTYYFSRIKEFNHRFTYKNISIRTVQAMSRFNKCIEKKPKSLIKEEIRKCKKFWKCFPLHYYRYDLYRIDKELSDNELINYIPEYFFYNIFLTSFETDKYNILFGDKNVTEQFFRGLKIPQTYTLCICMKNGYFSSNMEKTNFCNITEEIIKNKYERIFVKPSNAKGGSGIYVFNRTESGKYYANQKDEFNEDFLNNIVKTGDYLIQPGIVQDQFLSKIYEHSVNTLRILTENKNEKIRILCSTLRMGRDGKQVDNSAQDGIFVKIDNQKGTFEDYATSETCEYFETHPNTGFLFKGNILDRWSEIKELVITCAKKIPQFIYIAWDVLLTRDRILILEANTGFCLDHYQIAYGGLREVFSITDPMQYWKKIESSE